MASTPYFYKKASDPDTAWTLRDEDLPDNPVLDDPEEDYLVRAAGSAHAVTTGAYVAPSIASVHIAATEGGDAITEADAGATLWAVASVSGYPAPTLAYQWQLDGSPISGATGEGFDTTELEAEDVLTVTITATNAAGEDDATSAGVTIAAGDFDPASIFANGETGFWPGGFDPSRGTMFQTAQLTGGAQDAAAGGAPVALAISAAHGGALGAEGVTNGDFAAGATGWTSGTGWTVSTGKAEYSGDSASNKLTQPASRENLLLYKVSIEGEVFSAAASNARLGVQIGGVGQNVFADSPTSLHNGAILSYSRYLMPTSVTHSWFTEVSSRANHQMDYELYSVSVRAVLGHHAIQTSNAARPLLTQLPSGVWVLERGLDDALPINLPAGTYTRAWVDGSGEVTIEDDVAISGPEDILRDEQTADVLYVDRALTPTEKSSLTARWEGMFA